jgi:hypothetical protein
MKPQFPFVANSSKAGSVQRSTAGDEKQTVQHRSLTLEDHPARSTIGGS